MAFDYSSEQCVAKFVLENTQIKNCRHDIDQMTSRAIKNRVTCVLLQSDNLKANGFSVAITRYFVHTIQARVGCPCFSQF